MDVRLNDYTNTRQRRIGIREALGHRLLGVSAHKRATSALDHLAVVDMWSLGRKYTCGVAELYCDYISNSNWNRFSAKDAFMLSDG